jgi:hypothetical protein
MAKIQQHLLRLRHSILAVLLPLALLGQKFYPDDPLEREPKPISVSNIKARDINEYYDFFQNTFFEPDKEERKLHAVEPSKAVNTLGEVPDNSWFTNRIGSRLVSLEELVRGSGTSHSPAVNKPWIVLSGKNQGVTPGLVIRDAEGRKYFLKFDPIGNPGMATAADVIGAKFCYDLGYNVPENYIVTFDRAQLALNETSTFKDLSGHKRPMTPRDVDDVLAKVHHDGRGRYRGMASLNIPGEVIGPHRYYGTRKDDPNDIVDHESRRDQRGLYVFFAWLNHTDAKSINSLDSVVEENGVKFVKHFLIDFGDSMGSDSDEPKDPRRGHVYVFETRPAALQFLTLGLYVPEWMRADYPHLPEIGNFDYKTFYPEDWRSNYPNPAFDQHTPGDDYWAARKVMAFSDQAIRAIVETGQYSDPRAVEWAAKCLIERRNRIGRTFFNRILALDNFVVRHGKLAFDDLAVMYGFHAARQYSVRWSTFDNETGRLSPIAAAAGFDLPAEASAGYRAARIQADDPRQTVTVYLRGQTIAGIDRTW